jgi:predicted metal-dependent hydrolase
LSFEEAFDLGVKLYENGHPWHAHEVWEDLWQGYEGPGRGSLQALIQLAAARHHAVNGNTHGVATLLQRSLNSLAKAEAIAEVDAAALMDAIANLQSRLENNEVVASRDFPVVPSNLSKSSE